MTDQRVRLTIDGQPVECAAGSTIYEAATAAGIHIPIFCHHPKLTPVGACRTCMVEIEGVRGLQTSCTTPVREGMAVRVHTSPAAVKQRRAIIEFLLTNHPLDCPVCDKGGECPLQDQALADGPGQSRYVEEKRHKNKRFPLGELIVVDQERCVLCWRCIRFLDEWADDHELDLFGRGATTRLETFPGRPLRSKWQGNTIDVCPVGALTSRVFRFEARVWELANQPSICPMCAVGCNIVVGVKNNRVRRIVPRQNSQINDEWMCDKGRFGHGFVDHADRLTAPLIRRNGGLQAATWDEALELVTRRFGAAVQEHGARAVGGLGSTHTTNEASYLFQRWLRAVVGSNNVDHLGRAPAGAVPLGSLPELEGRDAIVLLGLDPSAEAPLVELWIKKAVLRHGAKLVIAHPRRIELSRYGGPWLGTRPGSEGALAHGLVRALLDAGAAGAARAGQREEMRAWLKDLDPAQVERRTGAAAAALVQAARLLAEAKRPVILYGPDWARAGGAGVEAAANLALALGGVEAAFVAADGNTLGALEMGLVPGLFPGQQPVGDAKMRSRMAGFWGGKVAAAEGLDAAGMLAAAGEGALQALWVMGSDPAADWPGAGKALGRLPFLVVQDLFLTETAALAEVVLPAASFAETDGTLVNLTGRLQRVRAAKRPPGQARPDWWIVAQAARRMVDPKRQKAWEVEPAEVLEEVAKVVPAYHGVTWDSVGDEGWQPAATAAAPRRTFSRPEPAGAPEAGAGLILYAGRLLYDRGTLLRRSGRPLKLVPEAFVMLHPADAAARGLAEGDEVTVSSDAGELGARLRVSDEVVAGVAWVPPDLGDAPLSVLFGDRGTLPRVQIRK